MACGQFLQRCLELFDSRLFLGRHGPIGLDADRVGDRFHTGRQVGINLHPELGGGDSTTGHDAQVVSHCGIPIGMIFVPSKEGRSHSAAEWTAWDDIEAGANTLLYTLRQLAA